MKGASETSRADHLSLTLSRRPGGHDAARLLPPATTNARRFLLARHELSEVCCFPHQVREAERRQALGCSGTRRRANDVRPQALARRLTSHDAGRSPLGAPPWRFSAGGRASISGIASESVQRAPRSQVLMPGGRCPGPPEPAVTSRGRRTPLPAPPFRTVSGRRPSMSEDGQSYTINSLRSQRLSSHRRQYFGPEAGRNDRRRAQNNSYRSRK